MKGTEATARPFVRVVLVGIGTASLALAVIGLVLPVLPSTPFVLLSAACYARASERLHRGLLRNRYFGPAIERWQTSRTISPRAKWTAIPLVALTIGGSTVLFIEELLLRLALVGTGVLVTIFLYRLPTRP